MRTEYDTQLAAIKSRYEQLIGETNPMVETENGVFNRYHNPILTAAHVPYFWKYDLDRQSNPFLMERIGINAAFNAGAIKFEGKYVLAVRVEGADRKSFFAIAESPNGIDNFRFWDYPVQMPQGDNPLDSNIYDMRLVAHEDGWIYGLFCTERRDPAAAAGDQSAAVAQCGIARTHDLKTWERLPDLKTRSAQQRNVVLHPEFVDGQYVLYTRPQDSFIEAGKGGGIGYGVSSSMNPAVVDQEAVIDQRVYHTVYEAKNGLGPAPIKTEKGWLHLAHGVRNTAAGLRYVLYLFMTDLNDLKKVIHKPSGYFIAPEGEERIGDVSNVVFSNGWIADEDGQVFIYYASSDTRMHVATSTLEQLIDYVINTPEDGFTSAATVKSIYQQVQKNEQFKPSSQGF